MRKLYVVAVLLLSTPAWALQYEIITGKVIVENNRTESFIDVLIAGMDIQIVCDFNGVFRVALPKRIASVRQNYRVLIYKPLYEPEIIECSSCTLADVLSQEIKLRPFSQSHESAALSLKVLDSGINPKSNLTILGSTGLVMPAVKMDDDFTIKCLGSRVGDLAELWFAKPGLATEYRVFVVGQDASIAVASSWPRSARVMLAFKDSLVCKLSSVEVSYDGRVLGSPDERGYLGISFYDPVPAPLKFSYSHPVGVSGFSHQDSFIVKLDSEVSVHEVFLKTWTVERIMHKELLDLRGEVEQLRKKVHAMQSRRDDSTRFTGIFQWSRWKYNFLESGRVKNKRTEWIVPRLAIGYMNALVGATGFRSYARFGYQFQLGWEGVAGEYLGIDSEIDLWSALKQYAQVSYGLKYRYVSVSHEDRKGRWRAPTGVVRVGFQPRSFVNALDFINTVWIEREGVVGHVSLSSEDAVALPEKAVRAGCEIKLKRDQFFQVGILVAKFSEEEQGPYFDDISVLSLAYAFRW